MTYSTATTYDYQIHNANTSHYSLEHKMDAWREDAFRVCEFLDYEGPEYAFYGETAWVHGASGEFSTYSGTTHRTRGRYKDGMESSCMMLVALEQGDLEVHSRVGVPLRLRAGSIGAFKCTDQESFHWIKARQLCVLLPRATMLRRLGVAPEHFPSAAVLDDIGLVPFLRGQMRLLQERADSLSRYELASMLDITVDMALMVLGSVCGRAGMKTGDLQPAVFVKALRFIESHCHKPDLNAESLAQALGCSRAKLYRIFASQHTTVHTIVRNVRLEKARRLIEESRPGTIIGTMAYSCGFVDQSSFGKMFKERYGVPPGEWRAHRGMTSNGQTATHQYSPPATHASQ